MLKIPVIAGSVALALLFLTVSAAEAQNVAANGDFELQDRGPWELTGQNQGSKPLSFDVDGDGYHSWSWKRQPGVKSPEGGNGGLAQTVNLVAGVTYEFSANVCFHVTC